jgi:hypothetical protein
MGKPAVEVCRTDTDKSHVNTLCLCACAGPLMEKAKTKKFKTGASGEEVKELHDHLKKFNFDLELSDSQKDPPVDSDDVKHDKWGTYTTRALRMFAKHPQVDKEPENIIESDGTVLTEAIANKICQWCSAGVASPKNYWEFNQLSVSDGKAQVVDAHGDDLGKGKQSAWHHHIRQIQEDLSKTGFGVHKDDLCEIGKNYKPDGEWWEAPLAARTTHHPKAPKQARIDRNLRDLSYLTRKFQRQAGWLWRMKKDGTHLGDVKPGDPTHYAASVTGIMDQKTAKVLHAWATGDLHMVINKFVLTDLDWPPGSGTALTVDGSSTVAKLRSDAHAKWLAAAQDINNKHASIEGDYSSSPRGWSAGKQSPAPGHKNANSPYSWHYLALGVDISQALMAGDGSISISKNWRYILEEETDRFRIWCLVDPQPAAPADAKDDKTDPLVQYCNRNIRYKANLSNPAKAIINPKQASDASPLGHMNSNGSTVSAALTGWYVDITAILETNKMMRIRRHSDWKTNAKAWEWWHYQFEPPKPAWLMDDFNFGDYFQMIGVHEWRLRNVGDGWPAHEDIEIAPG